MLITSIKAMEVDTDPANYGVHEVMNRAFMEQTGHLTRTVTWSRQASGLEFFLEQTGQWTRTGSWSRQVIGLELFPGAGRSGD